MKTNRLPLIAVIEQSDERIKNGQQPVMTVLQPMNRLVATIYKWLFKPTPVKLQFDDTRVEFIEYVVELDSNLFELLSGSKDTILANRDVAKRIKLVLTPSLDDKAAYAVYTGGDAIP